MKPYYTNETFRFTDKGNNSNERSNFDGYYKEQINLYGQEVEYFVYNYSTSGHDMVYGEHPTGSYHNAIKTVMLLTLNEGSILLSKFGLQGDDDITGWLSISTFSTTMSSLSVAGEQVTEPKSGDIFTLTEYGDDRPGDRGGKSFEITERLDQQVDAINPLAGHYVWQVKAKRLDYTFEPGLTAEKVSDQVYDNSFSGRLSGYTNPQTETKKIVDDIDTEAKKTFDYTDVNDGDDVYGDYY